MGKAKSIQSKAQRDHEKRQRKIELCRAIVAELARNPVQLVDLADFDLELIIRCIRSPLGIIEHLNTAAEKRLEEVLKRRAAEAKRAAPKPKPKPARVTFRNAPTPKPPRRTRKPKPAQAPLFEESKWVPNDPIDLHDDAEGDEREQPTSKSYAGDSDESRVLTFVGCADKAVSISDVVVETGIFRSRAARALKQLVDDGKIVPIGKGRGAKYSALERHIHARANGAAASP